VLTKKSRIRSQRLDIEFGWRNARAIGQLDIGQCVVVRDCAVMAVEAIEGTDATILGAANWPRSRRWWSSCASPTRTFSFDLPATGIKTIESMAQVKAALLAVEAGQSLLFDRDRMIEAAERASIVVVGVEELADGRLDY
jgi:DUF1009 family protein